MKFLLPVILILLCQSAVAAGKVNYLNVVNDLVYFSTDEIKASSPSCVLAESANQWTISLETKTGRALYSLLVSAMSADQAVSVESGADCADVTGIERAKGISLQPANSQTGSTGVTWAGYTDQFQGHFVGTDINTNESPVLAATKLCQAKYPDSRIMLWNDYISIISTYPHSETIWFLDPVSSTGTTESSGMLTILKNGQSYTSNGLYKQYNSTASCNDWRESDSSVTGFVMDKKGKMWTTSCASRYRLACVSQ
ncbi:hypothetical protein [Thalassomonas sp. RHCl1]|uniref:hypothetical protein n=1 Tax=Thalassomonas sp. RHCl1 TaxID=2995320 RepID=UPI00248AEC20|nr:hypothetical protein [Thalassomonas sp. RHCl1]